MMAGWARYAHQHLVWRGLRLETTSVVPHLSFLEGRKNVAANLDGINGEIGFGENAPWNEDWQMDEEISAFEFDEKWNPDECSIESSDYKELWVIDLPKQRKIKGQKKDDVMHACDMFQGRSDRIKQETSNLMRLASGEDVYLQAVYIHLHLFELSKRPQFDHSEHDKGHAQSGHKSPAAHTETQNNNNKTTPAVRLQFLFTRLSNVVNDIDSGDGKLGSRTGMSQPDRERIEVLYIAMLSRGCLSWFRVPTCPFPKSDW